MGKQPGITRVHLVQHCRKDRKEKEEGMFLTSSPKKGTIQACNLGPLAVEGRSFFPYVEGEEGQKKKKKGSKMAAKGRGTRPTECLSRKRKKPERNGGKGGKRKERLTPFPLNLALWGGESKTPKGG